MDVRQLELFLAVLECSGITKAAEKVNLTPAAISIRLQHLAAELNTDLFVRSGQHLQPTPAALRLAELARGVVRQMDQIKKEFTADATSDSRPFYFATGATTLVQVLGPPLRRLRKQFPNTRVEVTVCGTEEMIAGLLARRFDLALISLPCDNEDLTIWPLFEEELLILKPTSTRVPRWHVGSIQPADLASVPFLLYDKGSVMRTIVDNFFAEIRITPTIAMEADDAQAIRRLVEAGFGHAILPEHALRGPQRFFRVYRVPGHKIIRRQALAMVKSNRPRVLTEAIARFFQAALHISLRQS